MKVLRALRIYITSLSGPKNWNDFADLLSKTVVAAASAIVATGIWLYSDYQERLDRKLAQQEERHVAELKSAREGLSDRRDVISLFLQFMPRDDSDPQLDLKLQALSSYCSEDTRVNQSNRVVAVLCESVGRLGISYAARTSGAAATAATAAAQTNNAEAYLSSKAAGAQIVALAASESAEPRSSGKWFAVIASVPLSETAAVPRVARALNERLRRGGMPADVHIFRTVVSQSYALTSGGGKTEADAKARVRALRRTSLIPDAFAQPDRDWVPDRMAF
jgi:hypothetical protein